MPQNQFKPFATGEGATALPSASFTSLISLIAQGFQEGVVPPEEFNTVMRGPTSLASMVGEFINNRAGDDALDNGDIETLLASFEKALLAFLQPFGVYFIADTGSANHLVGTTPYPPAVYSNARLIIIRKAAVDNSGALTANFWDKGDVPVNDNTGAAFASGAVKASSFYALVPDGAGFRVIGGATSYTNVTTLTANSGDMVAVSTGGVVDFRTNRGTHEAVLANLSDNDRLPYGRAADDHAMFQTRAEFVAWLQGKFPGALAPLSYNPTSNRYEIAQATTTQIGAVRRATGAEIVARKTATGQPTGYVAVDDLPGGAGIQVGSTIRVPGWTPLANQISIDTLIGRTLTGDRFVSFNNWGLTTIGPCLAPGSYYAVAGQPAAFWYDSRRSLFIDKQTWTVRNARYYAFPIGTDVGYAMIDVEFECTAIAP